MKKSILKLLFIALLATTTIYTSCSSDDTISSVSSDFILNRDDLRGEIHKGEVVLTSGTYKLTGKLLVQDGAKLIIKPGVIIEATQVDQGSYGSVRYIAVAQGGKIDIQGTVDNPVIMTSELKSPGSWGGLVICGKAPINKGINASAEVSDLTYGGNDSNDSSGSIKYLRIEYSGFSYNSEKEFNGLSLFGVGKGTTIEYVQVYEGSDDGFEFFGGTVDAKYLIVLNESSEVGDDLFDWTEGWVGNGEYWYGKRTNAGNRGVEADNNSNDHLATPISYPNLKNITLVGNGDSGSEPQAFKLRVGTKALIDNLVLANWKVGFDVQHDETVTYAENGEIRATRVNFVNVDTKVTGKLTSGNITNISNLYSEDSSALGAGNSENMPNWAVGWTIGL